MNLYLFDEDNIVTFNLPNKKIGNFWMTDYDGKNIINISSQNNEWILTNSENTKIFSSDNKEPIILKAKSYYIVEKNGKRYLLYSDYAQDDTYVSYEVNDNATIKFGSDASNDVSIRISYFLGCHFILTKENGFWKITRDDKALVYINNCILKEKSKYLNNGDLINVFGLKVFLIKNVIFVNNIFNIVKVSNSLIKKDYQVTDKITSEEITNVDLYNDDDYFLKSPRMQRSSDTFKMTFDSPPAKENMLETPLILTLAPMLTMAASSLISLSNAIETINSGQKTWKQNMPTLIISISMLLSMLVWPFITRWYEKKQKEKREKNRQEKYKEYLNRKSEELYKGYENQRKVKEENLTSTDNCYDIILNKRRFLWERRKDQGDFLTVRIGKGNTKFDADFSYNVEDFTMEDDNLKTMLDNLVKKYEMYTDIPIGYSFANNKLTTITGLFPKYLDFTKNVLLQMMAFHGYDDLKFVIFTNNKKSKRWDFLKESPYIFSNDKRIRFFATNLEEMQEISSFLDNIFNNRRQYLNNAESLNFSLFESYYLIIIDDISLARKTDIINDILDEKANVGFSLVILEERLSKVPSEVSSFINIGESASAIINTNNAEQIRFNNEINTSYDMNLVTNTLLNTPIDIESLHKQLPSTISFLELFNAGQIEQLNVLNRWANNNPVKSLRAEIGVDENNDSFILDIHEKQHGPHGLIAGMTGSGKSEFIITYILSMAINYSPEDVNFVLIDYKGGGLAGAFVNSELGIKLPHVVGTITNLDKTEINRALSSINSELRRRQAKFNDVRDKTGESTIDIYKYQKLYREGVINEPIPHLIIICDEFAELKDQQPDFMDDLISTARIGRSLGVHLILATQKPSGVVDSQIWSNSRFKVCLKVQDKEDSMEMIKNDLAAELKNVGRFYLQVGYNEYFAQGQAAWAGAQYYPSKEYKKAVDKNIYFIDNIASIETSINNAYLKKQTISKGEELTGIVKYLIDVCSNSNYNIKQLWLDKIPPVVLLDELIGKYSYAKTKYNINPVIGEYDDPENQIQGLLTIPISNEGNVLVYGSNDSGVDEFLNTFIYSCITTYSTDEINIYILDFGAETLTVYKDAPQIGNVILEGNYEEINNIVKMLYSELNKRKKAFMTYGGSYNNYIRMSGKTLPHIVIVINSIETLSEEYENENIIEELIPIIREGSKYGISFVISSSSRTSVKFKIVQSCKQVFSLRLNDEDEYRDVLGTSNKGIVPSNSLGRGIVRLDRVVEFQTAFIDATDINNVISQTIDELNKKGISKAKSIPVMPNIIEIDQIMKKYDGIKSIPIGFTKETLMISVCDYSKNVINVISANELNSMQRFITNFAKVLELNNNLFSKCIIDACSFFDTFDYKIDYVQNKFNELIDNIKKIDTEIQNVLINNNMNLRSLKSYPEYLIVILGFNKFFTKLDEEHKQEFINVLNNQRESLKIHFIFVDTPSSLKKYEYEEWYKDNYDSNNGLWIGPGVNQQYTIKTIVQPKDSALDDKDYGVLITNGIPSIVKLVNEIVEDN